MNEQAQTTTMPRMPYVRHVAVARQKFAITPLSNQCLSCEMGVELFDGRRPTKIMMQIVCTCIVYS